MARTITFFPAPSEPSAVISLRLYGDTHSGAAWTALKAELVEQFDCADDALHIEDCAWADGERFADFVTLDGRIVGSLNEQLTSAEWDEFSATRVADPELLIKQVIAAARARAAVSVN